MRDNPDDLANQKIKRAITKLKNIVGCLEKQPPETIKDLIKDDFQTVSRIFKKTSNDPGRFV